MRTWVFAHPPHVPRSTLNTLHALAAAVSATFKSRAALQLENLALRHQLGVLQRSVKRPKLAPDDRLLWAWLCAVWSDWRSALVIVKPDTVIAWHRRGFRLFWTWKSAVATGPADGCETRPRTDPSAESRESAVGRTSHSRRTPQAWHQYRRNQRRQVCGAPSQASIADLANLLENHVRLWCQWTSSQCRRSGAVCISGTGSRPPPRRPLQRHRPSDRRVDRAATTGGFSFRPDPAVSTS